jgi:hypothetical protein
VQGRWVAGGVIMLSETPGQVIALILFEDLAPYVTAGRLVVDYFKVDDTCPIRNLHLN